MATAVPVRMIGGVGGTLALYRVAANGQSNVTLTTGFRLIDKYTMSWHSAKTLATAQLVEVSISGGTITFTCTHAGETSDVDVEVWGLIG
jgi:hypothetical protein